MRHLKPIGHKSLSFVVALATAMSGCVPGMNSLQTKYDDPADACNYARQPLIETESEFSKSILIGAAVGGAAGAATGAAVSKDRGSGALVGGLVGAAAGAFGGYLYARQQQTNNRAELLAAIDADARRDNAQLVRSSNAITTLTRCRQDQMNNVAAAYRAKQISAGEARTRYQRIAAAVDTDNALIAEVLGKAGDRSETYVKARSEAVAEGGGTTATAAAEVTPVAGGQVMLARTRSNIRSQPTTQSQIVGGLSAGQGVEVVGESADKGWYEVVHNNGRAFVAKSQLGTGAPAQIASSGDNATTTFAATTRSTEVKQEQHKTVRKDVQTRIDDLSAVIG